MESKIDRDASAILKSIDADLHGLQGLPKEVRESMLSFSVMGGQICGRPVESVIDLDIFAIAKNTLTNTELRCLRKYLASFGLPLVS